MFIHPLSVTSHENDQNNITSIGIIFLKKKNDLQHFKKNL